jgi:hypothetical protein
MLMEVNRWFYQRRGLNFDDVIPKLLPEAYVLAECGPDGRVVRIESLAQCVDSDVFLIPAERSDAST